MHTGHAANIFSVKVSRTFYNISAKSFFFSDLCEPAPSSNGLFLIRLVPSPHRRQDLDHRRSRHKSPRSRSHREGNHPHVLRSHQQSQTHCYSTHVAQHLLECGRGRHDQVGLCLRTDTQWPSGYLFTLVLSLPVRHRQYDLRENSKHSEVLVDLTEFCGQLVEAKCLAVNPRDNNYLAVGANGPFVRLYDIRMIHNYRLLTFSLS